MASTPCWVYILHCDNDCYYTGYTTDLARRFAEHVAGTAKCKFTRSFKPLSMAQCWVIFDEKNVAMKMEKFIKKLPRSKKLALIENPMALTNYFSCEPLPHNELILYSHSERAVILRHEGSSEN